MDQPGLPTPLEPGRTAVAYVWTSPGVALSTEGQRERIRRHCADQGWEVASELSARRFPDLIELVLRVAETEAPRVVLTHEAQTDLERRFPEVWRDLRVRFGARRVALVVI